MYFANPGTPALEAFHDFGSGHWRKGDHGPGTGTGQITTLPIEWDSGQPPNDIPLFTVVTQDQNSRFSDTLSYPSDAGVTLRSGFDTLCFNHPGVELDLSAGLRPDITDCCWQRVLARMMELLDEHLPASTQKVRDAARLIWGVDALIDVLPGPDRLGVILVVRTEGFYVTLLTGVQDTAQFLVECFHGLQPTQNQGQFGTSNHWFDLSTKLGELLFDFLGMDPDHPITFVGHSRGGVVSYLLAARMVKTNGARDIEVLTYGCPKPGDVPCVQAIAMGRQRHLANAQDPIPFVPPQGLDVQAFIALLGAARVANLSTWNCYREYQFLEEGQQPMVGPRRDLPFELVRTWLVQILRGQLPEPVEAHLIRSYQLRLQICCNGPEFPFTQQIWDLLFGDAQARGGLMLGRDGDLVVADHDGGLLLAGEGSLIFAPGDDCDSALQLSSGETFAWTTDGLNEQWYKYPIENGNDYTLTMTADDWTGIGITWYHGPDCANLDPLGAGPNPLDECVEHAAGADEFLFVKVIGGFFSDANYTITFDEGTCP